MRIVPCDLVSRRLRERRRSCLGRDERIVENERSGARLGGRAASMRAADTGDVGIVEEGMSRVSHSILMLLRFCTVAIQGRGSVIARKCPGVLRIAIIANVPL